MTHWSTSTRQAAITRLVKADIPLDGIYYWYPTPRGWDLMTWYLDDQPGETPDERQRRFAQFQHPNVWPQVLALMVEKWDVQRSVLDPIRNSHDAFPRGRVYGNRIGRGEYESQRIPGSFEKVCRAFNRDARTTVPVEDGHWDAMPATLPLVAQLFEQLKAPGFRRQGLSFQLTDPEVEPRTLKVLEELSQKGQISPGLYDSEIADDLLVNRDGQIFTKRILPVGSLRIMLEPSPEEIAQGQEDLEARNNRYPVVYAQGQDLVVKMHEGRLRAAQQQGMDRLYVWYYSGFFART